MATRMRTAASRRGVRGGAAAAPVSNSIGGAAATDTTVTGNSGAGPKRGPDRCHARRLSMRRIVLVALAVTAGVGLWAAALAADDKKEAPVVPPKEGKSETIKLFNGKDLDGWEGHEKYWSVKDGVIVGKNTDEVPVSTYLVTKQKFSDFRLL